MTNADIHPWQRLAPLTFDRERAVLRLLDQTVLPFSQHFVDIEDCPSGCAAIQHMLVRGAPLLGLCGAFSVVLALRNGDGDEVLHDAVTAVLATRPTAVNLSWAVSQVACAARGAATGSRYAAALTCALALQAEEAASCAAIADHGLPLLEALRPRTGPLRVLTHCNAGWLATGAWGTALGPVYAVHAAGIPVHVWVDETRPRNQGARLTAWELMQAGIPCTVITDNNAGLLMQRGLVDVCLVGSDRTTARGDVCNKVGTYQKALAAQDNGVPFYVALPCSTIDWQLDDGADIRIEQRASAELQFMDGIDASGAVRSIRVLPDCVQIRNDAFDLTPARLVSGLICEHGVFAAEPDSLGRLRLLTERK